jgi:protein-S-isoprenylcysteine O-methyltransferase Ste14
VAGTFIGPFLETGLLLLAAGTPALPRAWLFLLVSFVGMFGQIVIVALKNPGLVNHRGQWKKKKDTKRWDRFLMPAFGLLAFYGSPVVMGLDAGRYHWSGLGLWAAVTGAALFMVGSVVMTWAMLSNTHFEATVRIQRDRNHKVMTGGPYRFVRHPGYVGASLWALAGPLMVGSAVGLIPAGLAVVALVIRTVFEDMTLRAELTGYVDYARRVRYRLIPGLW